MTGKGPYADQNEKLEGKPPFLPITVFTCINKYNEKIWGGKRGLLKRELYHLLKLRKGGLVVTWKIQR